MSGIRFCPECQSCMQKNTSTGTIGFVCRCQLPLPGEPSDTLMYEKVIEASETNLKYSVFIDNAAHDLARNIVRIDCPQCKLDYMTIIRIGINETVMYVCDCGFNALASDMNGVSIVRDNMDVETKKSSESEESENA